MNIPPLNERISHIETTGEDYNIYILYFKSNVIDGWTDEHDKKTLILNEKDFYSLDKLYDGDLACKVIN